MRAVAPLRFVNGGGTGSVERTAAEPAVTEVAAGSGLYGPTLFDAYRAFTPAPGRAVRAARRAPARARAWRPRSAAATPPRAPRGPTGCRGPVLPPGLRLDRQEGAGEVQTPLRGPAAAGLRVGDRVWFRHAKAGELCERFGELHLVRGARAGRHRADLPRRGPRLPLTPTRPRTRRAQAFSKRPSGSSSARAALNASQRG